MGVISCASCCIVFSIPDALEQQRRMHALPAGEQSA